MKFKLEWLDQIADQANVYEAFESLRPYSGRGMFGRQGPAMSVSSEAEVRRLCAAAGVLAAELEADEEEGFDPMAFADAMETDSLGFGRVIYWPGMELDEYPEGYGK